MASPLYVSSTRRLTFDEVPEPLRAEIVAHAARASLLLREVGGWLTHRENPPSKSLFGRLFGSRSNSADPDPHHDVVLLLHPTHVVVGTHGPVRGSSVLSLPLAQATVARGGLLARALGPGADAPSDDGLTISGFPGTDGRPGTFFVGLGAGPDAEACFAAVSEAIVRIKNPG